MAQPNTRDLKHPGTNICRPFLSFTLKCSQPKFWPRLGQLRLTRAGPNSTSTSPEDDVLEMETPNILVCTSRGVIPHLSRDHYVATDAIKFINVPFESFLEQCPPTLMMQRGSHPLHDFLGFDPRVHIVSLCLRDPLDTKEMPPNGNTHVSANCVRGVRRVTPTDWRNYVYKTRPDVLFALSDTPFTALPRSQKRITKSVERSTAWLANVLQSVPMDNSSSQLPMPGKISDHPLNIFVHMAGDISVSAREAFAYSLSETLPSSEVGSFKPLRCLDDGVSGYSFDLAILRGDKSSPLAIYHRSLPNDYLKEETPEKADPMAEMPTPDTGAGTTPVQVPVSFASSRSSPAPPTSPDISSLLRASLTSLPGKKPRLVTGARSPHEMLRLMRDVGIDIFDAGWAIMAANIGIALDFVFPLPQTGSPARTKESLGHNLYDLAYAHQFGRLSYCFSGAGELPSDSTTLAHRICPCIACSPRSPPTPILNSGVDTRSYSGTSQSTSYKQPCSRAYVHHLLHTHEMSAHTLLVSHNVTILAAFLSGVRDVLANGGDDARTRFAFEVDRFMNRYDESMEVFDAARRNWMDIEKARGKGRLAREKEKQGISHACQSMAGFP